jgi:class 3 adenylate cyclase
MVEHNINCAVMFADIAESTRLYEAFGDETAQQLVSRCLSQISQICGHYGGSIVKMVGDEVMCRFSTADDAVHAACQIHEDLAANHRVAGAPELLVRIGLHFGPAILQGNDLFGDTVNLAARMTTVAKAGQIITTEDTVNTLSIENAKSARLYDKALVKGKQAEIAMYEILWKREDATNIISRATLTQHLATQELKLKHNDLETIVLSNAPMFLIGRSPQCDLVVDSGFASRTHARIEYRRGKFVLIDQSTNGTFVKTDEGKEVYLRREELPLWGEGNISLGEVFTPGNARLITYICR